MRAVIYCVLTMYHSLILKSILWGRSLRWVKRFRVSVTCSMFHSWESPNLKTALTPEPSRHLAILNCFLNRETRECGVVLELLCVSSVHWSLGPWVPCPVSCVRLSMPCSRLWNSKLPLTGLPKGMRWDRNPSYHFWALYYMASYVLGAFCTL